MTRSESRLVQKVTSAGDVLLRDATADDLHIFFEQQADPAANYMAAVTVSNPTAKPAFVARWTRMLGDCSITVKTVLYEGRVAGCITYSGHVDKMAVGFWIGKEYWGMGIATRALTQFLGDLTIRPVYAHAAKDNVASLRVLEKCGFTISGYDRRFANTRGEEIDTVNLILGEKDCNERVKAKRQ